MATKDFPVLNDFDRGGNEVYVAYFQDLISRRETTSDLHVASAFRGNDSQSCIGYSMHGIPEWKLFSRLES